MEKKINIISLWEQLLDAFSDSHLLFCFVGLIPISAGTDKCNFCSGLRQGLTPALLHSHNSGGPDPFQEHPPSQEKGMELQGRE